MCGLEEYGFSVLVVNALSVGIRFLHSSLGLRGMGGVLVSFKRLSH